MLLVLYLIGGAFDMKAKLGLILSALFVMLLAVGCAQTTTTTTTQNGSGEGRVVFTATDAAADMGAVSEITMTIDSVQVHSQTEGWVTVTNEDRVVNLLELKAESAHALIADAELDAGTYDQIRLDVKEVIVTDNRGEHEAKLPSNTLSFKGDLEVEANQTSSASFDFLADQSLHMTGKGEYIMAPVVKYESRDNVQVDTSNEDRVVVQGGSVENSVTVGMNAEGQVGVNIRIPANANVSIGNGRVVVDIGSAVGIGGNAQGNANGQAAGRASADTAVDVNY